MASKVAFYFITAAKNKLYWFLYTFKALDAMIKAPLSQRYKFLFLEEILLLHILAAEILKVELNLHSTLIGNMQYRL